MRVHVEKVTGNIRNKFKILNGPVPTNFLKDQYENNVLMNYVLMNYIARVCCTLVNLCDSVIPLDKPNRCNENVEAMASENDISVDDPTL